MKQMPKNKIATAVLLCALTPWVQAFELHSYWQRDVGADLKDGQVGSLSITQLGFSVSDNLWDGGAERLSIGGTAERTRLDLSGSSGSYYWFSVPLHYQQWRSPNTELLLKLEPGVMASLADLDSDTFTANAELSGRYYFNRTLAGQLGVVVDRRFGDAHVYPLLAAHWQADSVTQVVLGFPFSEIKVNWSDDINTYARVEPAGGVWQLKNGSSGGTDEDTGGDTGGDDTGADTDTDTGGSTSANSGEFTKVKLRNWRAGTGVELRWRGDIWLNTELGYLFGRKLVTGASEVLPENTFYWQLGLSWRY